MPEETAAPRWADPFLRTWTFNGFIGGRVGKKDLTTVYDGFQVASHCWQHETVGLVSDDVFLKAAVDARNFLEETFGRECRGFAWPCGKHTPETEQMLAEAGFRYGRTVENISDVTANTNPLALASSCSFQSSAFWRLFDAAKSTGVFYFWGHSYEMMDVPQLWERLELKIKTLSEDPDVEWVDVIDLVPLCGRK